MTAPAGAVRPGMSFDDLLKFVKVPTEVNGQAMRAEDWLDWRRDQHFECRGEFEQHLGDGRWLRTFDVRTRRGGIASRETCS